MGIAIVSSGLFGCAVWQPLALPEHDDLANDLSAIDVSEASRGIPGLNPQHFDISDGLDLNEIALLAVANNPSLRSARQSVGETAAEVYAAHLFPDPRLSLDISHPTNGADVVDGRDLGLSYDIQSLVTRNAGKNVVEAAHDQRILQVLWRSWQVAQQARQLAVRVMAARNRQDLLRDALARYRSQYQQSRRLLKRGDATLASAASVTSAWFKLSSRFARQRQLYLDGMQELKALLGVSPDTELPLVSLLEPEPESLRVEPGEWRSLPRRRPDLLALAAGYESQEQRVRQAVLSQFPSLEIGFSRGRDMDGLYTTGLGVNLKLPLFSRGRGRIAVERATRKRLRAEYQARLDQARGSVARLQVRQRLVARRLAELRQRLPDLRALASAASKGYQRGDLAPLDWLNLDMTQLDYLLEEVDLKQALWEVRIALETLLARPVSGD